MKHAAILYLTSSAAFAASTAGPGGVPAALLALLAIVALPATLCARRLFGGEFRRCSV